MEAETGLAKKEIFKQIHHVEKKATSPHPRRTAPRLAIIRSVARPIGSLDLDRVEHIAA